MTTSGGVRSTEYRVSPRDIACLMAGEGGVDLKAILRDGKGLAMQIVGVKPGTTAARLGARDGDTIDSLNGIPLSSVGAAYRAADLVSKDARIVVRGLRGSEPYETILLVVSEP